ncbi:hypothetical protein B1R32_11350 [Abditibacterium utsteinense]|uniref:mannan endo-1,4-beta-mannosidase n=1 Tax=Abditibacterium utsteinense TaxID=1960156 RepID=A0A2S8SR92_9BACT|nr:hypothetical protein [Abditibacterium utsteinense]PQV63323.1 hypothetical protein B1R32_11350 [Abditibacterium utsteinense]
MISKSFRLALAAVLLLLSGRNCQASPLPKRDFVGVVGNQFRLNGRQYKALGFTSYQLCVATNPVSRAEVEKIFRSAKSHGFSLFRATSVVYRFGDGNLEDHLSEAVGKRLDLLLEVARLQKMKVILDFSTLTYETGRNSKPPFDVTSPANFARLKPIYQRIPNRINTLNKRRYKDDPTIFGYSVLGEIAPFGLRYTPQKTLNLSDESRDVDNYLSFIHAAAAQLKRSDPNHLVNAGGLLHLSPNGPVKDKSGQIYWKTLWADPNIDFASAHIYPNLDVDLKSASLPLRPPYPWTFPLGEWKNLPVYKSYADKIRKPFMVEEWGLSFDRRFPETLPDGKPGPLAYSPQFQQDYFKSVFAATLRSQIPVMILWQWHPGGSFDLYPGESSDEDVIVGIVAQNAPYFRPFK